MQLDLNCHVQCADGAFGELADLVIDEGARRLTHLVVQPHGRHGLARLVPVSQSRLDDSADGGISLSCTIAELEELEPLSKTRYLPLGEHPIEDPGWSIGITEVGALPMYETPGIDVLGAGLEPIGPDPHVTVSYDRIPAGTVEICRHSDVTSSDGHHVGHVVALVIDERAQITELIVEHSHLWAKRNLAIPIHSIDRLVSDELTLTVPSAEIGR